MSTVTPIRFSLEQFRLNGRSALVTGASSGLGRVFASALASAGACVTCVDIDIVGCEETAAAIRATGGEASAFQLDVSDADAVADRFEQLEGAGKGVAVLVNNAGIASAAVPLHKMPITDWDRVLAVNLRGVFLCARAALPGMVARRQGSIINLSSIAGLRGITLDFAAVSSNYAASKGAVIAMTRQIAVEYGDKGIRCNAIAPGWHLGTGLGREALPSGEEALEAIATALRKDTPMARTGSPEELAGLMVYLASDASSFVTGQVIAHDGGWTAW